MEYLDFYATPNSVAKVDIEEGYAKVNTLYGSYADLQHLQFNTGDTILNAYGCTMANDNSAIFLYLGESFSEMLSSIIPNFNRYNIDNVKKVWPHFYQSYQNGQSGLPNKIRLTRIRHYNDQSVEYWVTMLEKEGKIDFRNFDSYFNALIKLTDYTTALINEVLDTNGNMPLKETLNIYAKEIRDVNKARILTKLLGF